MNDGVKEDFQRLPSPPRPARDSGVERARWTRPIVRELGCVQETETGYHLAPFEGNYTSPTGRDTGETFS